MLVEDMGDHVMGGLCSFIPVGLSGFSYNLKCFLCSGVKCFNT